MDDIEPSARLYNEDGAEFMTITALYNSETDEPQKTPITFVLRNNQLVTVRYADPKPFRLFERLVTRPTNNIYTSGEKVMLGLIEAIIDRLAQLLETTGDEIDQISREVFRNKTTQRHPQGARPAGDHRADRQEGRHPHARPRKPGLDHPPVELPPDRRDRQRARPPRTCARS